jgi:hypothetical protein
MTAEYKPVSVVFGVISDNTDKDLKEGQDLTSLFIFVSIDK